MESSARIKQLIQQTRQELTILIEQSGSLVDKQVVEKSTELDRLLMIYLRQKEA